MEFGEVVAVVAVTIGSNINSFKAVRSLDSSTRDLSSVYERLSSGQKINRASDDAAGLAVSSSLNAKSRIYSQGIRNVNDGLSMLSIAEGALGSLRDIVTRVSELSEQAASGTYSYKQRVELDREADSLLKEYNRIIQSTSFNGMKILDGSQEKIYLQHGIGSEQITGVAVANEIGNAAGDGTFLARKIFTSGSTPRSVAVGDLNSDGVLDFITGEESSTASVFIGNGDGTFKRSISYHTGSWTHSVSLGDTNGDGILDIVSADYGGNSATVRLGNGDGTFIIGRSFATTGAAAHLALADTNNDGVLDIVTADNSSNKTSVLIGNGDGTFRARMSFATGAAPYSVTLADTNGDDILDILTADHNSNNVSVLLGNGNGTFKARVSLTTGTLPLTVVLADTNGDGKLDVISADRDSNAVSVFIGNGDGTFSARVSFTTGTAPYTVSLADLNNDGKIDIIAGDTGVTSTSVLLGNGDGTFKAKVSFGTGSRPYSVSAADFNGDGVLDIISADRDSHTTSVLLGNADSSGRRNNLVEMVDLKSIYGARAALTWSKDQLSNIAREMGNIGAYQSRLASVSAVLDTTRVNSLAASARITDTDVATDSASLVQLQILQRTGQAVLAQANQSPQIALMLLRGT